MPRFRIRSLLILIGVVAVLAWLLTTFLLHPPDPAMLALPVGATEVKQFSALPPIYQLKAKVTQSEFDEFIRRSELRPILNDDLKLGWVRHQNKGWWNPIPGKPPSHYSSKYNQQDQIAKYENGYLYFQRY